MYIDSHCHINDPLFKGKEDDYVNEAKQALVNTMLVVGYDLKSSLDALELANKYDEVYAAVGIIPEEVKRSSEDDLKEIEKLLTHKKVIAIGEIGLDYHWDKDIKEREKQKQFFIKQIELANKYHLPVSIHCRDAYEDTLIVLKNHKVHALGVLHCYSGSLEMAKEFIKLGYLLGIGGTVTFKNAINPKEVAKYVPDTNYVLETDAPYLTPSPHRGEINHSKYIPFIAQEIANLKGTSLEKVAADSSRNFAFIFKI